MTNHMKLIQIKQNRVVIEAPPQWRTYSLFRFRVSRNITIDQSLQINYQ